jgi:hypothetical protein
MRLFRILLVALFGVFAVIAGLFTAAVVSLGAALVLLVRRMWKQSNATPLATRRPPHVTSSKTGDVIDITATELPVDSPR